jgi:transketolase
MGVPTIFVYTHDSIALGEDGPTHQPIEHLMSLRAIPGLWVIRPADADETAMAWRMALERKDGPTALALTRQAVPVLDRSKLASAEGTLRGGYVLSEAENPQAAIVATGSEVALALEAQTALAKEGLRVRVVSLPCWEVFEAQDARYRHAVLPPHLPTVSVEAGATLGWERYADKCLGLDRFGASAPYAVVYRELGFTPERVVEAVKSLL